MENKPEEVKHYNDPPYEPYKEPKQRHGCLSVWLFFIIIGNVLSITLNFFQVRQIAYALKVSEGWIMVVILASVLNIVAAILLLNWKKIGFYIALISSLFVFVFNLMLGLSIWQALFGLLGIVVLYILLRVGNEYTKGWPQLD